MSSNPKKAKTASHGQEIEEEADNATRQVIAQFQSVDGTVAGPQLELPVDISTAQLLELINKLLENSDALPYSFYLNEQEVVETLQDTISGQQASTENVLSIVYQPQAVFRVRSVTRCTATIEGHSEAILHVNFSADGKHLASGSGDATVRVWDVATQTPRLTLKGHKGWVLAVAFSPNLKYIASGSMDKEVRLWDTLTGKPASKPLRGHRKWITCLAWEPLHLCEKENSPRLATGSKDNTIKVWDCTRKLCLFTISGHSGPIKALKWGGSGLLYSASQDRSIKVWDTTKGKLVRTLAGHGHWVNCLSLSSDAVLRSGPFNHRGKMPEPDCDPVAVCKERYSEFLEANGQRELLVSGSDDFTLFLWDPANSKKPIARMTGHQQPVNYVAFAPDGRTIASASFDGSVRLWNGHSGKFMATLRGHVQAVYQVCWSADSRMLISSSKDSTLKVWSLKTKKRVMDLPGHADEVFAVDWSPDGQRVASGGKDRVLKLWQQ